MRRGGSNPLAPRAYRVRQPIPRKHHSPALLRTAGAQRLQADAAEHERKEWQRKYQEQSTELLRLQKEWADEKRALLDKHRAQENEAERIQKERIATESKQRAELESKRKAEEESKGRDAESRRKLAEENARLVEEVATLRTKLGQSEAAHKAVSDVAESQRRTIRNEQQRRKDLESRLDQLLKSPKPSQSTADGQNTHSAMDEYLRAERLADENRELRRHRDQVAHERERIANRILRLMSPGQYGNHAASAGYDPTADPLIGWKTDELRVLDHYARWQKKYMCRVTARKLKEQRPIDEQAIEAALTDRWKLMTKPPARLRWEPQWLIVGFRLDERSEEFLWQESLKRSGKMQQRMRVWR